MTRLVVDWISFKNSKPLGESWLRSSRLMRFASGLTKILSFILIPIFPDQAWLEVIVYLTVLTNLLRAIPVISSIVR